MGRSLRHEKYGKDSLILPWGTNVERKSENKWGTG